MWKGIKKIVTEKIEACASVINSNKKRVVLGVVMVGLGVGLIVSGYIPLPLE